MQNLCNRGETIKAEFDQMRPKNSKPVRPYGLQKIHKIFNNNQKFRPIINITGSSHYLAGKFLTQLLYTLINNEFTLKDLFEDVHWIYDTPPSLFVNRHKYLFFDVKSFFTNVPIKKTIDVIFTQIYNDHFINTYLKKRYSKHSI